MTSRRITGVAKKSGLEPSTRRCQPEGEEPRPTFGYGPRMEHKYEVPFAKSDPETPPTMDEQIAVAREAARKLGVPNAESKPRYRVGRNSHAGEAWAYVEWTREGLR